MAPVQTTYPSTMRKAVAGMIASTDYYKADSCTVETAAGVGFGLAVVRGATDVANGIRFGVAGNFRGITIRDITLINPTADKYAQYQNAGVLYEGDIWVVADGAVVAGNDVTYTEATGRLGTAAVAAGIVAVPGAIWLDSAANGELARVRLTGAFTAT